MRPRNEQHKHAPQLQNEYFVRFFLKQWYLNNFCDYKVGLADFENEWCQGTSDSANKYKLESKLIGKTRNGIFLLQKKKMKYTYIYKKNANMSKFALLQTDEDYNFTKHGLA